MGTLDKIVDAIMLFVISSAFAFLILIGVGAITAPKEKDPCERGFVYLKGACVQGYWPERGR